MILIDVEFILNFNKRSDPTLDLNRLRNVEIFKMSQFEQITGKKLRVYLGPFFQTSLYFLENEDSIFMTLYKHHIFIILESIQIRFFLTLIHTKYSSYDRISKSQKNRPFSNSTL
jgi:hypothetical protein